MNNLEQFRDIFARFQNVNLLALIEDIRRRNVAREAWHDSHLFDEVKGQNHDLCPVAHGFLCGQDTEDVEDAETFSKSTALAAKIIGVAGEAVFNFVTEWDKNHKGSEEYLLYLLQSIWDERLVDAVATQEMIQIPEEEMLQRSLEDIRAGRLIDHEDVKAEMLA